MTRNQLIEQIRLKRSFLCIGLDTDAEKIPAFLMDTEDPVFEFNKRIIDATKQFCVAYKINTAFYESRGLAGWKSLVSTCNYLPDDCFAIADAKRGDIGNTAEMYAKAFFDRDASEMEFDAITVAPYMGADSVTPFFKYPGKWVILLALTSNPGSADFQKLIIENREEVFHAVINQSKSWAGPDQLMYVVGATRGSDFQAIRRSVPDHFLLVPGVGAQGGSLEEVCKYGMTADCGLLVNASRSVIYASPGSDCIEAAVAEASRLQNAMERQLEGFNFF